MDSLSVQSFDRPGFWLLWLVILSFYFFSGYIFNKFIKKISQKKHYPLIWCLAATAITTFMFFFYSTGGRLYALFGMIYETSKPQHNVDAIDIQLIIFGIMFVSLLIFPFLFSAIFLCRIPNTKIRKCYFVVDMVIFESIWVCLLYMTCVNHAYIYIKDEFNKPVKGTNIKYFGFLGKNEKTTDEDGIIEVKYCWPAPKFRIEKMEKKGLRIDEFPWGSRDGNIINNCNENKKIILPAWTYPNNDFLLRNRQWLTIKTARMPIYIDITKVHITDNFEDMKLIIDLPLSNRELMSSGKFDWSIELTVNGGGLKEVPIGFYETVPTTGYSNEIKLQFRKDDANYKNFFSNIYFFSLREGKLHGVMNIMIYPMDMFDDFAIFNGKPRILLDSKINKINNKIYWEQYE